MALKPAGQLEYWTFWRVVWATLVLAAVVVSFWLLYRFYQAVFILLIAILIGITLNPVVDWLNRKGLPRWVGCLLVYLVLLALVIRFFLLLLPLLVEQGTTIAAALPGYYKSFQSWMVTSRTCSSAAWAACCLRRFRPWRPPRQPGSSC